MNFRKKRLAQWAILLLFLISCEAKVSKPDRELQSPSLNAYRQAVMDTSNMEKLDGVPVMSAPGAQIDKSKIGAMLKKGNTSYRNIVFAKKPEEIESNIKKLKQLLHNDGIRNDKELRYIVHTMLGTQYVRLFKHSKKKKYLDQAGEHLDLAISLFKNQPAYKADLADAYTARIGVYAAEKNYEQVISTIKYLIEQYQGIGFGPYKNWFAAYQVDGLYNLASMGELKTGQSGKIIDYLKKIAEEYDNEVGITAQIALVQHYFSRDDEDRVVVLSESVENRLASLNNPDFKKDKWERVKSFMAQMEHRKE